MTIWPRAGVRTPAPGVKKLTILGLPGLHNYAFSFSSTCAKVEKKIFEICSNVCNFDPTPRAPWVKKSSSLQFRFPLHVPQKCFTPSLKRIGHVAIGHLSDSGGLKLLTD